VYSRQENYATVLVTPAKNVAERVKYICMFKPRYKMAHKLRYNFVVSVASAKDFVVAVLIPVSVYNGRCYPRGAITQ
jgi:hypothetical protein